MQMDGEKAEIASAPTLAAAGWEGPALSGLFFVPKRPAFKSARFSSGSSGACSGAAQERMWGSTVKVMYCCCANT